MSAVDSSQASSPGFFAVDRRTWARVCSLGMNPAVAYLVLARGTGRDNRTSTWSVHAIEAYTGISRGRAQAAVSSLEKSGLINVLREGTRPQYYIRPAHQVPSCDGQLPPALEPLEQLLFDQLLAGET